MGNCGSFSKGSVPWNKNLKTKSILPKESLDAMSATQFKKGERPCTAYIIGTISVIKDKSGRGYKYISVPNGRNVLYHRFIWESQKGKIPEGCILRFKDGDTMNCDIDNLICVSRSENMKMNSYHRYGREIANAIQLRGALNRQINKRIKQLSK